MKLYYIKLFLLLLSIEYTFILTSCTDDYHNGLCASDAKYIVEVTPHNLEFQPDEGEVTFIINSNKEWSICSDVDWLMFTPSHGNGKYNKVVAHASQNPHENNRTATIVVQVQEPNIKEHISVVQIAKDKPVPLYIDMALPSGTMWASCNIGAIYPWDAGYFYAFGETLPKIDYSLSTYPNVDEYNNPKFNYIYNKDKDLVLPPENDAASMVLGEGWCTPTFRDFRELREHCTHKWVDGYGRLKKSGELFVAKNGNELFFPASGCMEGTELKHLGYEGFYWGSYVVMQGMSPYCTWFYWKEMMDTQPAVFYFGYNIRPIYRKK